MKLFVAFFLLLKNGDKYIGEFKDGKANGKGKKVDKVFILCNISVGKQV
jgi:hypothetical protein